MVLLAAFAKLLTSSATAAVVNSFDSQDSAFPGINAAYNDSVRALKDGFESFMGEVVNSNVEEGSSSGSSVVSE